MVESPSAGSATPRRTVLGLLSDLLAGRVLIAGVAAGWTLTMLVVLVLASPDATTILLSVVVATSLLGGIQAHRHGHDLRRRMARAEAQAARTQRLLRAADGKLDQLDRRSTPAALDQQLKTLTQATSKSVAHSTEVLRRSMVREITTAYHELEALQNLYAMVAVDRRVPPMRGWAASPDLLLLLVELLREEQPSLMVECGSGASTLWAALAIRQFGLDTRLVALEHDAGYARQTMDLLAAHGVGGLAEVRHTPLQEVELDAGVWQWYARDGWADLRDIGLLFVDGPPGRTGPHARFPALPLLGGRLTDDAVVVLDDLIRVEEQEIVERWLGVSPAITEERVRLEKVASVLRRQPAAPGSWTEPPRQAHPDSCARTAAPVSPGAR